MPAIVVRRTVDASTAEVWASLSDFAGYGRWIPLTSMVVDPPPVRVGWGFAGVTGLGPVGFVDSMLVTRWEPPTDVAAPARFTVRKTGRLLRGWADIIVGPSADGRTEVVWQEEIVVRPETLGRRLARVVDPVVSRLFARALDKMLEAAASGTVR